MNTIEYWAMNNPLRAFVQRRYEAPRLMCPEEYVGIDLDPRMIRRARTRAAGLPSARFAEGDVSTLEFPDACFDLIVDFGILHHVPDWRRALAEVHRTLRIGGEFLFEDLPAETWERGIGIPSRRIADHPYDQMFRKQEFVDELLNLGCKLEVHENSPLSFYHFWGRAERVL